MQLRFGRTCASPAHYLSRRAFLGSATGAMVSGGIGLNTLANPLLANQLQQQQKRVICIFLSGGASQFETWDPKPGKPTGGPFQSIQTSIPGVRISELLPKMADRLHKHTAIIRSFSPGNDGHDAFEALSGHKRTTVGLKYPTLGCMLTRELARPDSLVPYHVALYAGSGGLTLSSQDDEPGFFGARYGPINILSRLAPPANRPPDFFQDHTYEERAALRDTLSQRFLQGRSGNVTLTSHHNAYRRMQGLMANERLFDITQEPMHIRDRYGPTLFGQQALVGRRLSEAGVPFVRLNRGWWDSHGENFETHSYMVPELDRVMSTLLDDLENRGLLEHTLVITFSEMGRTPLINSVRGRDHWGRCWSAALSGCGIRGGVVYGSTNANGTDVAQNRVSTAEFFATIFAALGLDHQKEYPTPDGRPIPLTEYGTRVIQEVLA